MNLIDELERSFGDGPAPRPVDHHLAAGRGALRRRRGLTGVVGAAAGAVALTVVLSVTGGTSSDTAPDAASDPSPAATAASPWIDGDLPVRYVEGVLVVRPGATVHERIENPYDYAPPLTSTAIDLTFEGERSWILADQEPGGEGFAVTQPSNGGAGFADWVATQAGLNAAGDDGRPVTMVLTDEDDVVAGPGSEVLRRTDDPRLGDAFAAPGEPTGAALVRAAEDGGTYFLTWRVVGGELDVVTVRPADGRGLGFEELLTYVRGMYANGEGLR